MGNTKLPPTVLCADCGEPSAVYLMHHYWDRSVCLSCYGKTKQDIWTVWVGGGEVNAFALDRVTADRIADSWRDQGYDDVQVAEVTA